MYEESAQNARTPTLVVRKNHFHTSTRFASSGKIYYDQTDIGEQHLLIHSFFSEVFSQIRYFTRFLVL